MACECNECREFGGPDPTKMKMKFFAGLIPMFTVAILGLIKEKRWKELRIMGATAAVFFTVPRYLICARCDGYGKNCYAYYLGKLTSMYLPKVEGKKVGPLGLTIEAICLAILSMTPAWGLRKKWALLGLYGMFSQIMALLHLNHACRHCYLTATDWRKNCLIGQAGNLIFGYETDAEERGFKLDR
ncbi:MAG: hypothetical protein JW738_00855 [Actinobacteria bacterium]|nr:hypothetical protein [Actinomycetota bacterium]